MAYTLLLRIVSLFLLNTLSRCFQFQAPSPSCNDYTINTLTQCTFILYRDSDINLNPTAWNTELVPAGASIVIKFPSEYVLSGSQSCAGVSVKYVSVTGYTCTVSTTAKSITITNAIPTALAIDNIEVTITGIRNPSPALVTGSFLATIGADTSAADVSGTVSLMPGLLTGLIINFDPATVNTTANMIVTATLGNTVPANGSIVVTFSATTWARQATPSYTIPISSVSSCSAITNLAYTLRCTGTSSTTVTITGAFSSPVSASTLIKFSINGLISPPTTEQIDSITVTTYQDLYMIDSHAATVSGLVPRTVTLGISTPSAFTINSDVVIDFSFVLADTVTRWDIITIQFPVNSTVVTQPYNCSINLASITYSTSTSLLTLVPSSTILNRLAGSTFSLRLRSYRTPSSVRTTDPFTVTVLNNTGLKMTGSATILILPKAYTATASTLNTTINSITTYTVAFTLADEITSSGYFLLRIPAELTLSAGLGVSLTSTSMASAPTIQFVNSMVLRLRNLNTSASNIGAQGLSIRVGGLQQPGSVKTISSFVVDVYYSSSNDLVAQATTTTTITTTPGSIVTASVSPSSSFTAATGVTYTFSIQARNPLPTGSRIVVTIPSTVTFTSGGTCAHASTSTTCTATPSNSTISINLLSAISAGSTITTTYSLFTNPGSTRPTGTFGFATFNGAGEGVDVLGIGVTVTVAMSSLSGLGSVSLVRGSRQNSLQTSYTFTFTQVQPIVESSAIAQLVFPSDITLPSSPTCTSGSLTLVCTLRTPTTLAITFTPVPSANNIYNFTILSVVNPYSFKPTSSITITTQTTDFFYKYSIIGVGLEVTNVVASDFGGLGFNFTNQFLTDSGSLNINLTMRQSPGYIIVQFAGSFAVGATSPISCNANNFVPLCTLQLNNDTGLYQIKVSSTGIIPPTTTLTFSTLTNPATIPSDFTWVTSYTADDFKISENKNTVQFTTFCTFPCRECETTARNVCLSCYSISTNLTNRIYLFQSQCLAVCPIGYLENNLTYICQPCSAPCYQCSSSRTYCTSCLSTSLYKYLNRTNTTSTCVSQCPIFMYADVTQIPNLCVACAEPCGQCTTRSSCVTCVMPYLLYGSSCLTGCPVGTTVEVNGTCVNCSSGCLTCSILAGNCTSCPSGQSLYQGQCYVTCPGNLISVNSTCQSCDPTCRTCSIAITNCTSCLPSPTPAPYFYSNLCLSQCPQFFYSDTFFVCQSCDLLQMGCKNCSSPTVCVSCDAGFVLLFSRCLDRVPDGYLNISGIAVACQGECATCVGTLTYCTSCRTLNLFNNTCQAVCPVDRVPLNRICVPCTYPCSQCLNLTTTCTKCSLNSSLYLSNNICVSPQNCPTFTYANNSTQACTPCVEPCSQCNSSVTCVTCVAGFFYVNQSATCETGCPPHTVGVNRVCMACVGPCLDCQGSPTRCLSCISGYYYNAHTLECLASCPAGQIANDTIMQCVNCASPCKTCINTTDTCLSCITGTFLSNTLCVARCPDGQYGSSGLCRDCQNNCTTCSSAVHCLSCSTPLALYSAKCIENCPVSHAIVSNDSVCIACGTVVPGCSNCSANGQCYACYFPNIYYNSICLTSCPEGYSYTNFTCVPKSNSTTDIILTQTLESYTFPIPFTILGCLIFIACCMSKLQNTNTYLIGILYSLFGLIETGSMIYLTYQYFKLGPDVYVLNYLFIMLAVLGAIYVLNVLGLVVQTPYLVGDGRFGQWLKTGNRCFFAFVTILSLLINYKAKMILFSKLFKFHSMNAFLQNVYRFRLFNIFSFFGLLPEGLTLYVCIMLILKFTFQNSIFHALLDVIIIFSANIVLAVLIVWKDESFFHEETEDGYAINKRINDGGDDFSKEAILGEEMHDQVRNYGPESYSMINKANLHDVEEEDEVNELEVSLTDKNATAQAAPRFSNMKVYFSSVVEDQPIDQTSSKLKQQQKVQGKTQNIFSDLEAHDERYSQHGGYQSVIYQSEKGGSVKPSKQSPQRHLTIVVGPPINNINLKTNLATENEDVEKKISQRERELDEIRRELEEQEQIRKQKRKSRKKLKKTVQLDLSDKQPSYQQITIKDSSQKMPTEQDSNLKTAQQKNLNGNKNNSNSGNGNGKLNAESRQEQIDDNFNNEYPKESIGSWMELRIAEENKKLPVFSENIQEGKMLNTISLPESHDDNQEEKNKQVQIKKLQPQSEIEKIDSDVKKYEEQRNQKEANKFMAPNLSSLQIEDQLDKDMSYDNENERSGNETIKRQVKTTPILLQKAEVDKEFSYIENVTNQMQDSSNTNIIQKVDDKNKKEVKDKDKNKDKQQDKTKYFFEEQNAQYDQRAGTRLNFQKQEQPKQLQDDDLEDSRNEDEKINQRPYSAARRNKTHSNNNNNQALLQILAKVQQEKLTARRAPTHQITQKDERQRGSFEGKSFRISGGPIKSQINEQDLSKDQDLHKRSRMYMAGLSQFQKEEESKLNRKKTMNYPLNSMKKKSLEDSQAGSSFVQMQQSRNKSFNTAPFRKFASKDLSSDNLDQLGIEHEDYKKNYEQLMNQRYPNQRKPGTSGTARSHSNQKPSTAHFSNFRRANFTRDQSQDINADEDSDLDQYYKKQGNRSNDKKEKQEKKKSMSREKSFEETKRVKELERIYLARR